MTTGAVGVSTQALAEFITGELHSGRPPLFPGCASSLSRMMLSASGTRTACNADALDMPVIGTAAAAEHIDLRVTAQQFTV